MSIFFLCFGTQYSLCTTKATRIETVRAEAEQQAEVEMAMMEEERRILEKYVRVSAKRKVRTEAMRFKRER